MLEGLRQKVSDWINTDPYGRGFGIYSALFLSAFFMASLIVLSFSEFNITEESARSFISTSNQIQATILAIVISLTLLAVEMTASKYSPRVIEIFKKNATLWFFLYSYIISIIIGSIILTLIGSPNSPIPTTLGTLFVLVLGICLALMLILYVFNTLDFLNAERIVKSLADLIDTETISSQVDPFQSVFDVIYGAIKINDFTTMSTGLICAEERLKEIMANAPGDWRDDYILDRFFDDLKRCGFLLIERNEDKYAFEIITRLKTINEWVFKEQKMLILNRSCPAVELIAIKACESGMVSVIDHSLTTLREIAESVEKIEGLTKDDDVMREWCCTLSSIIESISNIGKASIRYELNASSQKAIKILNDLGRYAIGTNLTFKGDFIFKCIGAIVLESVKQNKVTSLNLSVQTLEFLGGFSIRRNRNKEPFWVLDELKEIGKYAAHQNKAQIVQRVVKAIRHIAIDAMENEMTDVRAKAIELSISFQLLYPAFFKDKNEIRPFNYDYPNSITISKEKYDNELTHEFVILDEYVHPPDNFDEDFNEDYDDRIFVVSL